MRIFGIEYTRTSWSDLSAASEILQRHFGSAAEAATALLMDATRQQLVMKCCCMTRWITEELYQGVFCSAAAAHLVPSCAALAIHA